jgi:hypothetical protein
VIRRWSILAVVAVLLSSVAAADHPKDADYYRRTGTKPPIDGNFLLGPTVNYADKLGAGGTFGYTWNAHGVTLLGEVSAVQIKGENGSAEFRRFCQTYKVPYSTGDRTVAEVGVSVLFTLKPPKK